MSSKKNASILALTIVIYVHKKICDRIVSTGQVWALFEKKNGIYKILIKLSLDYTHIKKILFLLSKRGDRSSQRRI